MKLKPAGYVRMVEHACVQRNLRLTPLRAQVLRIIAAARRPLKAYDVLGQMIEVNGDTAPTTAYRALDFLAEHGFIHRLASLNAYVACQCPDNHRSVPFLICETCHAVVEIMGEGGLLDSLASAHGFQARAQTLEVQGACARCRSK